MGARAEGIRIDELSFEEALDGILSSFFAKLYSPEKADLLRRAYAATQLTILSQRAPFGHRASFSFTQFGEPQKISSNSTRTKVLALYVDVDPAATFIFSSGPGPAGGGSDFIGDGAGEASLFGNGIGARRFILLPSEELWATQLTPPLGSMTVSTEAY